MNSGVYRISNTTNNQSYIGSSQNIEMRLKRHFYQLSRGCHANKHLQSAWNKYGESSFSVEVIEVCGIEDLLLREQFYIDKIKPEYNQALFAGSPMRGKHHSPDTLRKMSDASKGVKKSDETRERLSMSLRGRSFSPETLERMSIAKKGKAPTHLQTDEVNKKRANSNMGRVYSDETKNKISNALKGNQSRVGTKHSEETRLKMRRAWELRKEREQS